MKSLNHFRLKRKIRVFVSDFNLCSLHSGASEVKKAEKVIPAK